MCHFGQSAWNEDSGKGMQRCSFSCMHAVYNKESFLPFEKSKKRLAEHFDCHLTIKSVLTQPLSPMTTMIKNMLSQSQSRKACLYHSWVRSNHYAWVHSLDGFADEKLTVSRFLYLKSKKSRVELRKIWYHGDLRIVISPYVHWFSEHAWRTLLTYLNFVWREKSWYRRLRKLRKLRLLAKVFFYQLS